MSKKTQKEWEDETGVILRRKKCNKMTESQFKKRIKQEYIICRTEKGLDYLNVC